MALTLKAMTYFTTALHHGNIAKAAGELHIAASAVSSAIDQVEHAFDLTLVTRQRARGITATASGRAVARKLNRLLEDYADVMAEGALLKHAFSGVLRIGYYAPIAPAFLPDILSGLMPDLGAVTYELEECDNDAAQDGLLNGSYDAILFVSEDVRPSIEYDTLIEAPPYCLLPADHPLSSHPSVSMAQLANEPLVVLNRPVAGAYYQGLFDTHLRKAPIAAFANATEMVRSLVSAGHGCAILNMHPASSTTYSGKHVVARPISDPLAPLTLCVAYAKARPRRLVAAFAEACRAYFSDPNTDHCVIAPGQGAGQPDSLAKS